MKLYMVPLAPNPTKIMLYLKERELAGESPACGTDRGEYGKGSA